MGEPHLHSVDSAGVVTTPPPSEPPNGSKPPRRAPSKARPRYAVPTDRLKFDSQVQALRAICTASRNGQEPVTGEMMGNLMGILPVTAVLNNTFFASLGLLDKAGKGAYKPTDLALKFQQKWSFNRAEAAKLLAPAFMGSWFLKAVHQKLELGPATRAELIETLAGVAGTDDSYAAQYGFLLDWLEFVGLISTDGGMVKVTEAAPEPAGELADEGDAESDPEQGPLLGDKPPADRKRPDTGERPIVSFSVDIILTANDLARLSTEQIGALFEGIGRVAAVKDALNKP